MNNGSRRNVLSVIAVMLSLICLLIVIFILIRIDCHQSDANYMALMIGALALITSVLIGFQIVNIVQLDKKFADLEFRTTERIEESLYRQAQLSSMAAKMAENDAIGTSLMMLAWSFLEKNEVDDALRALINSLRAFQGGNHSDSTILSEMRDVEDALLNIARTDKTQWFFRDIDEKNVFIDTVMKIQDRDRMNTLLDFFYRFGIIESVNKK